MSFEFKDQTFSWVEWFCTYSFAIGLILSILAKNTLILLSFSLLMGVFYGKLITRWKTKSKVVAQIMLAFCALGFLIANFNLFIIIFLLTGTYATQYLEKNKLINSTSF